MKEVKHDILPVRYLSADERIEKPMLPIGKASICAGQMITRVLAFGSGKVKLLISSKYPACMYLMIVLETLEEQKCTLHAEPQFL